MHTKSSFNLSKTRFISGLQCAKKLYLTNHPPQGWEKDTSFFETMPIHNGYEVGDLACALYPGEMVDYNADMSIAVATTEKLLADASVQRIHEATLVFEGILVRVDLLERTPQGWKLIEVKGSTSVKDYYLHDAAVQAWVLQGCGLTLASVHLMHINNQFIYQGDGNYEGIFTCADITQRIQDIIAGIGERRADLMTMLAGDMPDIKVGEQCNKPFSCEFLDFCRPQQAPQYPISILPNIQKPQLASLHAAGYEDVRDIPDGVLSNANHQRVWRVSKSGEAEYDDKALAALQELPYPRYYLDFETISLAVPRWSGLRPYMQAPFQWSCHIQHEEGGDLQHVEFLDISGEDPRRACAEMLVKHMGKDGVLIAYNAGFEKGVIRGLAELYPDLSAALLAMNTRFFDLLPLSRKAYCHPAQKGSWSIKAVLPALVPALNYNSLAGVQNGSDAQVAWFKAAMMDKKEQEEVKTQLLAYCKLDTLAMVKMVEVFERRITRRTT